MDFVALPGGAEGAKTFWGLSWVYKSTTQKEKNCDPKIKNEKQFLCSRCKELSSHGQHSAEDGSLGHTDAKTSKEHKDCVRFRSRPVREIHQ